MWITLGIWLVVWGASKIYNKISRPPPKRPDSQLTEIAANIPRTDEGTPIPMIFGRVRVNRPLLVWYSPPQNIYFDNPPRYRYGVDMAFVVGIPMEFPPPAFDGLGFPTYNQEPRLWDVFVGDDNSVATGGTGGGSWLPASHAGVVPLALDQGGDGLGGWLRGTLTFYNGREQQVISNQLGNFTLDAASGGTYLHNGSAGGVNDVTMIASSMQLNGEDGTTIPNYRGQMLVAITAAGQLYSGLDQAFEVGESPQISALGFEVESYGPHHYSIPGFNGLGFEADPVEVIHDIIVSDWGKTAYPSAKIDTVSFQAASDTLCAEGLGYSRVHYDTEDAKQVIQGILKQINGAMYEEPKTGLLVMKLIRADYNPLAILALSGNGGGIVDVKDYACGGWPDTYNTVHLTYTSRGVGYLTRTAVAEDPGNGDQAGVPRRTVTVDYPGICTEAAASLVAGRELGVVSRPLAKCTLVCDRRASDVRPGDVVSVTWAKERIVAMDMRVMNVDRGTVFDGAIELDVMQDVFDGQIIGQDPADVEPIFPSPGPITTRLVTESPFGLTILALASGVVGGTGTTQRILAMTSDENSFGEVGLTPLWWFEQTVWRDAPAIFQFYATDVKQQSYQPGPKGTLTIAYPRTLMPYDTLTGVTIRLDAGTMPGPLPWATISTTAQNLIMIDGEIMGFESATPLGGGLYNLVNVSRGLLDTAEDDHAVGATVWFPVTTDVGGRSWSFPNASAVVANCQAIPHAHWRIGSGEEPVDVLTIRNRHFLPLRPQGMWCQVKEANVDGTGTIKSGSAAPNYVELSVLDGGVDALAFRRDRLQWSIARGDTADQPNSESGATYVARATKVGGSSGAHDVTLATLADAAIVGGHAFGLGGGGHGLIDLNLQTQRTIVAGDQSVGAGTFNVGTVMTSWQRARVRVVAPRWRNLLTDPRFVYGFPGPLTNGWQDFGAGGGVPTLASGAFSIRRTAGGKYMTSVGAGKPGAYKSTSDVSGYLPRGMRALAIWYARNNVSTLDNCRIDVDALDIAGASVNNVNGTIVPGATTWGRNSIDTPVLPASTASMRVAFTVNDVGGGGSANPDAAVSDVELIVGQFNYDVLTNGSFETGGGSTTGWTVDAGGFTIATAIAAPSSHYIQGAANASNVIHEDRAIPAGYGFGGYVLRAWRAQTLANDTGNLELLILDAGGATIASTSTGLVAQTTLNEWLPVRLAIELPDDGTAVTARIRWTANRALGAGIASACLDECVLSEHNQLDSTFVQDALFSSPRLQSMPTTWQQAHLAWPTLPRCDVFDGNALTPGAGILGYGFEWSDGSSSRPSAKQTGQFGGGVSSVNAYGFTRQTGPTALHIRSTNSASRYARFGRARGLRQGFTIAVIYSVDEAGFAAACGLVGRMSATRGWGLSLNAAGQPTAKLRGDLGSVFVTNATPAQGGGNHYAAITWDPVTDLLRVDSENGSNSISTAAIGEFYTEDLDAVFRIARDESASATLPGMISRVFRFRYPLTTSQSFTLFANNYAGDPTGLIDTQTRTAPVWCPQPPDAAGETLALLEPAAIALGWSAANAANVDADTGYGHGLTTSARAINLAPSFVCTNATYWDRVSAASALQQAIVDATGQAKGIGITAAGVATGIKMQAIPLTATATVKIILYVKGSAGTALNATLRNSAGVLKQTIAMAALTTGWQRRVVDFTTWDGSTANGIISMEIGTVGSVYVTHAFYVQQGPTSAPALWHRDAAGDTGVASSYQMVPTVPAQFNTEGEIIVEGCGLATTPGTLGVLASVDNSADNKNRRELVIDGAGQTVAHHWDAVTPTDVTSTAGAHNNAAYFQVRSRWRRAKLLDSAVNPYAGVISPTAAVYGRTAAWTPSNVAANRLNIGTGQASSLPYNGHLRRIKIATCEAKLP
jgi:hypothetical protein